MYKIDKLKIKLSINQINLKNVYKKVSTEGLQYVL